MDKQQPQPQPQPQPISPRRRLQELLAIPEYQRTDAEWDEVNELEISLASANRLDAPDPSVRRSASPSQPRQKPPGSQGRQKSSGSQSRQKSANPNIQSPQTPQPGQPSQPGQPGQPGQDSGAARKPSGRPRGARKPKPVSKPPSE